MIALSLVTVANLEIVAFVIASWLIRNYVGRGPPSKSIVDAYFFLPKTEPSSTNGGNMYTITNKKRVKWD